MAQKVRTFKIDDLDGSQATQTIEFQIGKHTCEIDLSDVNARRLREIFGPYIQRARRVSGRAKKGTKGIAAPPPPPPVPTAPTTAPTTAPSPTQAPEILSKDDRAAIRKWARMHGWPTIADRGRLPEDAVAAWRKTWAPEVARASAVPRAQFSARP